jgi:hypothetical protein
MMEVPRVSEKKAEYMKMGYCVEVEDRLKMAGRVKMEEPEMMVVADALNMEGLGMKQREMMAVEDALNMQDLEMDCMNEAQMLVVRQLYEKKEPNLKTDMV